MAQRISTQTVNLLLGLFTFVILAGAGYYFWSATNKFIVTPPNRVSIPSSVITTELSAKGIFSHIGNLSALSYSTSPPVTNTSVPQVPSVQYLPADLGKTDLNSYE